MTSATPAEELCACAPSAATPALTPAITAAAAEQVATLLKALADPVRLRLFTQIALDQGETCVCDLPDVGVSQPTVSHHLRRLREAGLIDCERRGTWVYYWATDRGRAAAGTVRDLG
jgi:ArsR family transcriptional regulator